MPIYEMTKSAIVRLTETSFSAQKIQERRDVQRLLRDCIEIISPDTMVLSEEFGDWVDSNKRIDLLGLDKDGSLVVVELKRSDDGGHMELQSLRYAAMVSTMTFDQAVEAHRKYLALRNAQTDAEEAIKSFLGTDKAQLSGSVRIVLASAEFSKEITSSVLWLNSQGLDISCVRLRPYGLNEKVLLDIQQVIPLPEAAEFQIAINQQSRERREAAAAGRDFTKYKLITQSQVFERLNKRNFIFQVVREAVRLGRSPLDISNAIPWRSHRRLFLSAPGRASTEEFVRIAGESADRYFCADDELIYHGDHTYAFTNQWGLQTESAVKAILATLPAQHGISYQVLT